MSSSSSDAGTPPPGKHGHDGGSDDEHDIHKKGFIYTHFEEVLARINPFGPYQYFTCFCILYASIEWAGNYSFMDALGVIEPDWLCLQADNTTSNITSPTNDAKCAYIKANCTQLTPIKESAEFHSLVAAFQLICDDSDKPKLIQIIQVAGSLIGSIVGGHIGDYYGRKKGFFSGQFCIILTSVMAISAKDWIAYSICQFLNGFLFGMIEVTSLTMMMEYTDNKYRLIPNACFQWPIAYMVMALIAYLAKDWQYFFIFLNLITAPITIGFMLFQESPRWLITKGRLEQACEVLNDMGHQRWNHARVKFIPNDLKMIPREKRTKFYSFWHLFFTNSKLAKQSIMQIVSMFTFSLVSSTYLYTIGQFHGENTIMFTFLDGVFRLWVPVTVIFLDYRVPKFGRKPLYMLSLSITALCFAAIIVLVSLDYALDHISIYVLTIIATMINASAFWMSIVQITTQRYPTVIRCIAFGSLHSFRHIGVIVSLLFVDPLLKSWTVGAYIVPEVCVILTLVMGFFLQPESKGKPLMDRMKEVKYGRFENEIPKALMRIAAGHRYTDPQANGGDNAATFAKSIFEGAANRHRVSSHGGDSISMHM
uniref:Major facilitator superfamily (MFS) profile domain-containing protein n=1 Tax=Plectus sambesii TaxID=2011161 RepID=A0A914WGL5_9BILA